MNLAVIVSLGVILNLSEGSHIIRVKTGEGGGTNATVSVLIGSTHNILKYDDPDILPFQPDSYDIFDVNSTLIDVELIQEITVMLDGCAPQTLNPNNTRPWDLIKITIEDTSTGFRSRCMCNCMIPDCYSGSTSINCVLVKDGGWGSWTMVSPCSSTCGTGTISRYRYCDNPSPLNGGTTCQGDSIYTEPCNTQCCPGEYPVETSSITTPHYTIQPSGSYPYESSNMRLVHVHGTITGLQNLVDGDRVRVNGVLSAYNMNIEYAVHEFCDSSVYRLTESQPIREDLTFNVLVPEDSIPLCLDNTSYVTLIPPIVAIETTEPSVCNETDGWSKYSSTDSNCYKVVSSVHKTWDEARLECIANGADLVTFSSMKHRGFILNLAKSGSIWIGITSKISATNEWEWINGTQYMGYLHFTHPQYSYTTRCAYIGPTGLNSEACSHSKTVVCERKECTTPCCTKELRGFALTGYNDMTLIGVDLQQCLDKCARETTCKNVEFWPTDNSCVISETSLKDVISTEISSLNIDKRVNFYEQQCQACAGFRIIPGDSNTYYMCMQGIYVQYYCPDGTYMDYKINYCAQLPDLAPLDTSAGSFFMNMCPNYTSQNDVTTVTTEQSTITTPQSTVTTQESTVTTQQSTVTTQESTVTTVQSTVTTPQSTISAPQSTVTTQESTVTTQQSTVTTQESTVTTVQSTVTTPQSTVSAPQSTVTTQESTISTQQSTVTTPKSTATTQQSTATTPQSTVTIQEGTVTTQQSGVTTQQTTSQNTVTSPQSTVTTSQSITPTFQTIISENPLQIVTSITTSRTQLSQIFLNLVTKKYEPEVVKQYQEPSFTESDKRPLSIAVGSLGTIVLIVIFGGIFLSDVALLKKQIYKCLACLRK